MMEWLRKLLFNDYEKAIEKKLDELKKIEDALNIKLESSKTIYTTIKSFQGLNKEYYAWVHSTLSSEEYKYMIFDLRENVLGTTASIDDKEKMMRHIGRLDMLSIIDNYLKTYKAEYESKIRGDSKNTER